MISSISGIAAIHTYVEACLSSPRCCFTPAKLARRNRKSVAANNSTNPPYATMSSHTGPDERATDDHIRANGAITASVAAIETRAPFISRGCSHAGRAPTAPAASTPKYARFA